MALSPIYFLRGSRAVGLEIMNVQHLAGAGCSSKARERRLFLRQRHFLMYASAIRLRLECLDAAVVIGDVRAVAFQLIELHSAPLSTRGRQDIEIGVSQSGGVAAALHNRRLATKICFASILRKSRGEHISASLCSMCLALALPFRTTPGTTAPNWRSSWRRIPRCNLSFEEKVLAQRYWPTGQHPRPPRRPVLPGQKPSCNKLPRTLGMRRLPGVFFL